jgi:hypothetical protein
MSVSTTCIHAYSPSTSLIQPDRRSASSGGIVSAVFASLALLGAAILVCGGVTGEGYLTRQVESWRLRGEGCAEEGSAEALRGSGGHVFVRYLWTAEIIILCA